MKRLWFAVIFLCIAASLCFFEQYKINGFYQEMSERLETAMKYDEQKNSPMLKRSIEDIQQYWKDNNDIIFTMTNHGVLDELSREIRALNPDRVENSLFKIRATLNVFYENQRITFSNIF